MASATWTAGWLMSLVLAASPAMAGTPLPDAPHIVVTGQASVSTAPDSVRMTFNFDANAARPQAAKQTVDAEVERLLARLAEFGIDEQDVQAGSLSTSEDVEYDDNGRRVHNGYDASRSVTVLLRGTDRLNALIDSGLAAGAKGVPSLSFESTQAEALRAEAKRKAADDARRRAARAAESFGASLGAIYSIDSVRSTVADGYGRTLDAVTVTGSAGAPARYLQPKIDYTESVQAVFELKR